MFPKPPVRKSKPFGRYRSPFDPQTGAYVPLGDPSETSEFTIVEVGFDLLLCTDRLKKDRLIAKAQPFRRSEFDEKLIGVRTYVSTGLGERSYSEDEEGTIIMAETLTPQYMVGEKIVASKMFHPVFAVVEADEFVEPPSPVAEGDYFVDWADSNVASRRWEGITRARAVLVTDRTDGNLLDCAVLSHLGVEIFSVVVARGDDLQAAFYDGETFGGVAYAKVNKSTRTADTTETQEVTPDHVTAKSILLIQYIPGGVGITDPDNSDDDGNEAIVYWIDNTPGRTWAVQ